MLQLSCKEELRHNGYGEGAGRTAWLGRSVDRKRAALTHKTVQGGLTSDCSSGLRFSVSEQVAFPLAPVDLKGLLYSSAEVVLEPPNRACVAISLCL